MEHMEKKKKKKVQQTKTNFTQVMTKQQREKAVGFCLLTRLFIPLQTNKC